MLHTAIQARACGFNFVCIGICSGMPGVDFLLPCDQLGSFVQLHRDRGNKERYVGEGG